MTDPTLDCVVCLCKVSLETVLIDDNGLMCPACSELMYFLPFHCRRTTPLTIDETRKLLGIHTHTPKKYIGFTDTYMYCEECNIKL